jgi:hypothetical protein
LNTPIYLWSNEGKTHTISEEELMNVINPLVNTWIDEIKTTFILLMSQYKLKFKWIRLLLKLLLSEFADEDGTCLDELLSSLDVL